MASLWDQTGDGTGLQVSFQDLKTRDYISVQSTPVTPATSVDIEGRMGSQHNWIVLATLVGDAGSVIAAFPFYRAVVTASAGLQTNVDISFR